MVTSDESQYNIAGVLSAGKIGADLPVAYVIRTLNPSQIICSTIEKEHLVTVWVAKKLFRIYVFGVQLEYYLIINLYSGRILDFEDAD